MTPMGAWKSLTVPSADTSARKALRKLVVAIARWLCALSGVNRTDSFRSEQTSR